MNKHFVKIRVFGLLVALAVLAGFAVCVMVLWNALMPGLFSVPALNYGQAAGILVLCRILFGGIGRGSFIPGGLGRDGRGIQHGNKLREKWMNMTEEERMAFIEKEKGFHHFFHGRFSDHLHPWYEGKKTETNKEDGNE